MSTNRDKGKEGRRKKTRDKTFLLANKRLRKI